MANAVNTGDKNHRCRCRVCNKTGVMPGPGDNLARAVTTSFGTGLNCCDTSTIKGDRGVIKNLLKRVCYAGLVRNSGDAITDGPAHLQQDRIIRMPNVYGQKDPSRDNVTRIGVHVEHAHRGTSERRMGQAYFIHQAGNSCSTQ